MSDLKKVLYCYLLLCLIVSCTGDKKKRIEYLVNEWDGREIKFPDTSVFLLNGIVDHDTIPITDYKILSYVDSAGCTSCKLRLSQWTKFITELNSIDINVPILFFICPNDVWELKKILRRERFQYPICVDERDELNGLNHFPSNSHFHTFLLDRNNKVVAIGNPVNNIRVKELYWNVIQGKEIIRDNIEKTRTKVYIKHTNISLGQFNWQQEQQVKFTLKNTGDNLLIIENVSTSCGCTSVSYSKEPIRPRNSAILNVSYKADHPEHFNKTITVYCNADSSPILLRIAGDAE